MKSLSSQLLQGCWQKTVNRKEHGELGFRGRQVLTNSKADHRPLACESLQLWEGGTSFTSESLQMSDKYGYIDTQC